MMADSCAALSANPVQTILQRSSVYGARHLTTFHIIPRHAHIYSTFCLLSFCLVKGWKFPMQDKGKKDRNKKRKQALITRLQPVYCSTGWGKSWLRCSLSSPYSWARPWTPTLRGTRAQTPATTIHNHTTTMLTTTRLPC